MKDKIQTSTEVAPISIDGAHSYLGRDIENGEQRLFASKHDAKLWQGRNSRRMLTSLAGFTVEIKPNARPDRLAAYRRFTAAVCGPRGRLVFAIGAAMVAAMALAFCHAHGR